MPRRCIEHFAGSPSRHMSICSSFQSASCRANLVEEGHLRQHALDLESAASPPSSAPDLQFGRRSSSAYRAAARPLFQLGRRIRSGQVVGVYRKTHFPRENRCLNQEARFPCSSELCHVRYQHLL